VVLPAVSKRTPPFLIPSLPVQRRAAFPPRVERWRGVSSRLRRRKLLRRQYLPRLRSLCTQSSASLCSPNSSLLTTNRKKSSRKTSTSLSQPGTTSRRANCSSSLAQKLPPTSAPKTLSGLRVSCLSHNRTPTIYRKKQTTMRPPADR